MQIYRIDHVGQVTPDLASQVALLEGLFGFRPVRSWDDPGEGCRGVRLAVPGSWGQAWEVLEPSGDASPLREYLDDHGGRPGLHHIGAEVTDVDAVRADLETRGLKPTAGARGRWLEASLSPPEYGTGVLFRMRGPGTLGMCGDAGATARDATAGSGDRGPSLGIVALDHVCQAFPDREELARWYADLAGFVPVWRTPMDEHPDMADLVMNIPGSAICWEIIMPRGEDSFIERFWDRNGPAAHHVTFEVADWDRALEACRAHDTPTFGENEGSTDGAAWRDAFIHPKHTGGVLVQLFWEERPGVWVRSDKVPAPWT
ncbi:VOC family protein [Actinomadura viridis]|uniref:Methylmalonyl-CoA/ethylmalonyl-CoA epimerase n=1 Tax=Actinomadura viridis TaxID=58110 RepID=A0A931DTX2_9ACTN|nr:VOC family protein [Actinomadura viridis]MBG6093826.1 methylmalonyl-CoA/ethylmalonyl-CoA epimerase [Actinomadura viridis]